MRRRLIAALVALLLAAAGAVVLLAYVRAADARALAGVQTVDVLVVDELVPEGTPAGELADLVRVERLPAKAAVTGGVTDLEQLAGQVATTDLQPGEQLLATRFAVPEDLAVPGTVAPPPGASEVSILLEPQRAVGGRLAAGDEIGVYVSLTLENEAGKTVGTTHATLHGALVTQVQGAPAPVDADGGTETASSGSAAPTDSLLVTVALPARDAELVVFGMEHGTVWLALEPEGADLGDTRIVTQGNVYGDSGLGTVYGESE